MASKKRRPKHPSRQQRKRQLLSVERRAVWLAEHEMELLLDLLERAGMGTSAIHKILRDSVACFRDAALKLRELEATAQGTAFWEDPEGWMRPLEKYLKSKHKGRVDRIAHEAAETIKQMISERNKRDARNTK